MKSIFRLNDVSEIDDSAYWGKLLSPVYAYLELTKRCNCNCDFCQVDGLHEKNSDINFRLFKKIVKELKKNNFLELRLGGGEPLISSSIKKIVKYINKNNLMFWVCTNGILLTQEMAEFLKNNGCIGVRISIDSHIEAKHNEIRRNPNAYKLALKAVETARDANLTTIISMTIGEHNINDVVELEKLAKEKKVGFITHPIMPVGRGVNFKSNEDYYCCSENIKDVISNSTGEKHCVAGTEMIAIDTLGNVSPCTFIKPKLSLKKLSLKNILNHPSFVCYKHPILNSKICENCKENAENCKYSDMCRGGCWALKELNDEN